MLKGWLFFFLTLSASHVQAIETVTSLGYGNAGDRIVGILGGPDQDLRVGQGTVFSVGFVQPISATTPHRFEAQVSIGYSYAFAGNEKEQNTLSWSRIPLDLLYFYRNTQEDFRFGWGVTHHFLNKITGSGSFAPLTQSVEPAWGWVVTVEKLMKLKHGIGPQYASLGVRYQSIRYKAAGFAESADASAFLLTGSYFIF